MSLEIYNNASFFCSKKITQNYSTSFSLGIKTLSHGLQDPIYAIYGMVRVADEIVDTFHQYPQKELLDKFKQDTFDAIRMEISTNPVLQCFQATVNKFNIPLDLIEAFFDSMYMDLSKIEYNSELYQKYIYGSAEVVGLMCLKVFCYEDDETYSKLQKPARALGAAFQKVNFLRDFKNDFKDLGRLYFPNINFSKLTPDDKKEIERDIEKDFIESYKGIILLPKSSRYGVLLAFQYYQGLLSKIKQSSVEHLHSERIRVSNAHKLILLGKMLFRKNFSNQIITIANTPA
jgi:phytoene/squalene synthetase